MNKWEYIERLIYLLMILILALVLINCNATKQQLLHQPDSAIQPTTPIFNCPKEPPPVIPQHRSRSYLV